jgi:hypothetical protein
VKINDMRFLIVFINLMFLLSCGSNKSNILSNVNVVELDNKSRRDIQLSDYIDTMQIIKLETSENVLLGSLIRNIQIFDNKLYILDFTASSLFVFNDTGKFVNKIYSVGQGPGEYLTLFDCYVDSSGIYLLGLGGTGSIILHYDSDCNHIRTLSLGQCFATSFTSDGEYFWLYTEPGYNEYNNSQILLTNSSGTIINRFFKHYEKTKENWSGSNTFLKYRNEIYFSSRYGNTVYRWNKTLEWEEFVTISAGNKTFKGNINDLETLYDPEFRYVIREYYFILNDWFIFNFNEADIHLFCFHNIKTKENTTGKIKLDLTPEFSRFHPTFQCDNCLIDIIMAGEVIHEYPELFDYDISLKNLDEEDNPVLIIYKFK